MYHSKLVMFSYVPWEHISNILWVKMRRYAGDLLGESAFRVEAGDVIASSKDWAAERVSGDDSGTKWLKSCCTVDCKLL